MEVTIEVAVTVSDARWTRPELHPWHALPWGSIGALSGSVWQPTPTQRGFRTSQKITFGHDGRSLPCGCVPTAVTPR